MFPSKNQIKKGVGNPRRAIEYFTIPRYRSACVALTSRVPLGTHILSRDWDVCILLDTCRVDALQEVADEYPFIDDVGRMWSVGGSSPEWMVHTFDAKWRELLVTTAYLTSNAWAKRILNDRLHPGNEYSEYRILETLRHFGNWNLIRASELGRFEQIWKYVSEDEQIDEKHDPGGLVPGGAPPRYVTDRAISVARNYDYDRLLLHYMEPHAPYLANALTEGRDPHDHEKEPFTYLQETGDRQAVWNAYLDELRYVLDDVAVLLRNIDAETVVISADHGEAFGEYNIYNHHTGSLHPHIRFVPWVVTSATDTGSYSPQVDPHERGDTSVDEALEALGYKR